MKKSKLKEIIKETILKEKGSSRFILLNTKKGWNEFEKKESIKQSWLINKEIYNTPSGLKFELETIGYTTYTPEAEFGSPPDMEQNHPSFYYINTKVKYEGKDITDIPGKPFCKNCDYAINPSITKAKKWLDTRGEKLIDGESYQYKST